MAVDTLTKKVKELEARVSTLERGGKTVHTALKRTSIVHSTILGSYQALARLKGLLKGIKSESPLEYQRRIRKESERISV